MHIMHNDIIALIIYALWYTKRMNQLAHNLRRLIFEHNTTPTQLSRATSVPQPTIQRIIAGTTTRPHISSLEPLAKHFKITVEQLLNNQAEPATADPLSSQLQDWGINRIPQLNWNLKELKHWLDKPCLEKHHKTVLNDTQASHQGFALEANDAAMEPIFPKGCLLTFDPSREIKDRAYILAITKNPKQLLFRQLLLDGERLYIKPLSPHLPQNTIIELPSKNNIVATLIQARFNYTE